MTQIITTSSTTTGINITAVGVGEYIYIAEGVTRASTTSYALISGVASTRIHVLGDLASADNCMRLQNNSGDNGDFAITIGASGSTFSNVTAITLFDSDNSLYNNGQIDGFFGNGVNSFGNDFKLSNTGTITSHNTDGVRISGSGSTIVNNGLIQSLGHDLSDYGINLFDSDPNADVRLTNYGTVSATSGTAFHGDFDDVDKVWNFGLFNGGVLQEGGNDFFRNGGQVVGDVDLGAGADRFNGWGGTVEGNIHGRGGNDTIAGGISDDHVIGDGGADLLKGGQGDDTLTGGSGRDFMGGGPGFDTFDFNETGQSAVGALRDHIMDFSKADDVIDLAGIDADSGTGGNQAFHFIKAMAFSGTAGELRAVNNVANTIVAGDVDGDGNPDFSILVEGVHNLHAADFVL